MSLGEFPELRHVGGSGVGMSVAGGKVAGADFLPKIIWHMPKATHARSLEHHSQELPGLNADLYLQDVMAALSTFQPQPANVPLPRINSPDETMSSFSTDDAAHEEGMVLNRISGVTTNTTAAAERPGSELEGHDCDQFHRLKDPAKGKWKWTDREIRKNQNLLFSSVEKFCNAAESVKKLYGDLVHCADQELRKSTDFHHGEHPSREDADAVPVEVTHITKNGCGPSSESDKTADNGVREDVQASGSTGAVEHSHPSPSRLIEGRAPCAACLPFARIDCSGLLEMEQPAELSKTAIDEVTIEFSDDIDGEATVNVVHNGDPDQPGYNIEITTPFESPRQEHSKTDEVLRKGTATWKDGHKPAGKRVTGKMSRSYKSASKNRHVVVRESSVCGGRDHKSPLKSRGNTRTEWNYSVERRHEVPENMCEDDPCLGLSNEGRDHKSPYNDRKVIPQENPFEEGREEKSSKNLFDEIPGHGLLSSRKALKTPLKSRPGKASKDLPDEIRQPGLFKVERGHTCPLRASEDILQDMPTTRSDIRNQMETRRKTLGDVSSRNDHPSVLQSSNRLPRQGVNLKGGEADLDQFPEFEVIPREPSHSAEERWQLPTRWTGNTSTGREARTQRTSMAQSENVDRAAAATGLAKEIEVMITHGAPKRAGNMKIREIKLSPHQTFPQDEQGEPYRHTKLDRAVVAAVQAVNKLKTIHTVSNLLHDEGHPQPAPQKRRPHPPKEFHKDTAGDGFYDQMHQELKELASERMKLVRQERSRCQTQFSLIAHRQGDDRDARKPHPTAMTTSDLRNLVGDGEDSSILYRKDLKSPASISGAWTSSYIPGAKRQRSNISPARKHGNKLLRLSAGKPLQPQFSPRSHDHKFASYSPFSKAAGGNILESDTFHGGNTERMVRTVAERKDKYVRSPSAHNNVSSSNLYCEASSNIDELDTFHGRKSAAMESTFGRKKGKHMAGDEGRKDHVEARVSDGVCAVPTTAALNYGEWKTPPSQQRARLRRYNADCTASRKKVFSKQNFRIPAWVDRMSQTRDVVSSFLPIPQLTNPSEECHWKASVRRRNLRPPPSTCMALWSAKMSEHMKKSRAISMMYFSPARAPRTSCKYDVATGRRIYPGQESPIKSEKRLSDQKSKDRTGSSYERIFGPRRHPITKRELKPRDAEGECKNYAMRPRGWNSDPWVLSDIPHKASDIIRENKNSFKSKGKLRRRIAGRGDILPGNAKEIYLRHVTFAAMESQSKAKSGTGAPKQPPLAPLARATRMKASPRAVRTASVSERNGVRKICCSKKNGEDRGVETEKYWAFTEEYWTNILKAELQETERNEAVHILATNSGCTAEPGSPTLQTGSACMSCEDNVHANIDHIQEEDVLRGDSLLPFISSDNREVLDYGSGVLEEVGQWVDAKPSLDIAVQSEENITFQAPRYTNGEDEVPSDRLGPLKTKAASVSGSGNDDEEITLHTTTIVESVHLLYQSKDAKPESTTSILQEGCIAESTLLNNVGNEDHPDDEIQLVEDDSGSFPRSPLLQLEDIAPTGLDYEGFPKKYDILQKSSRQIEAEMDEPGSSSLRSTRQDFLNTIHAHVEEEAMQLEDVDLERTLMDIVLHTILRDDPLQDLQTRNSSQRQFLTPNSRVEKDVEALNTPVDVIQSPLPKGTPKVDRATEHDNICCSLEEKDCQTLERDLQPQSIREPRFQQQETSEARHIQMHQATQSPWHCVGTQTADVTTPGSSTPLGPPSALPMFVPIYFAPYAPTLTPSVHFASPLHTVMSPMELSVHPPPVSSNNQSTQAVSTQSTLNSPHPHPLSHEHTATIVSRPPELPSRRRSAQKHTDSSEDDRESEWDDMKRLSSPPTPTTPLSSPDHKAKLKRAMAPYPVLSNTRKVTPQITANVKDHCAVTDSEVSQLAAESGGHTEYLDYKKRPLLNLSRASTVEERTDDQAGPTPRPEGIQTNSLRTSGGRSWARVKEMEEAALSLLRTVIRKTPDASSSSEYSGDTSPRLRTTVSPGELNSRGVGGSSNSGESTEACVAIGNSGRRMNRLQSHALGLIGSNRASIGEISNLLHMLVAPSEGEVAGALPSMDEVGQISHDMSYYSFSRSSINKIRSPGSEPGELHAGADSTSEARMLKSISVFTTQACARSSFSEGEVRPLQYLNYEKPVTDCSSSSSMHKKEDDNNSRRPKMQP